MFRFKQTCIGLCWCCIVTLRVYAQEQPHTISLSSILQQVNTTAPSLVSDSAAVSVKQAQQEATRYNWLPSLKFNYQANVGTNNNLPGGYFSYGIVPSNSKVRVEGNSSTIVTDLGIASFDWEVYNFGAFSAQQKVAASDVEVEQSKLEGSRYQLQAFTIDYYLQLVRIQNLLAIQAQNILRNTEIKRTIRSLAASGVKAGVDTSIAEAELSKARLTYIELSNQLKQAQLQLSYISSIPAEQILPDTTIDKTLLQRYAGFVTTDIPDTANHPMMRYYRELYQNSLEKETLVKKSYLPKVSLQAAAWGRGSSVSAADEFRSLSNGLGFERANYLVGVGITYNLFDLKKKQLQLNVQKANTRYAQQKIAEQHSLLAVNNTQADTELSTALERLDEIPHQLAAAQAAYRQKLSLYKNGLTDIVELNAALSILYRAETDYTNAKYIFCKALFQKAITENKVAPLLNLLN
ncbi:MAG: TolC family protein [Chitinophagaceae bacterium]